MKKNKSKKGEMKWVIKVKFVGQYSMGILQEVKNESNNGRKNY